MRLFGKAHGEGAFELRDFLQRSVVAFDRIELETSAPGSFAAHEGYPCLRLSPDRVVFQMKKLRASEILDARFPARRLLNMVGDKWTPIVLYCLSGGVRRFNELQRHIPDISKKVLIQVLRSLENDGLVNRTVYLVVPPKTEYRLTDDGRRLHEPIAALCAWSIKNSAFLDALLARRAEKSNASGRQTQ